MKDDRVASIGAAHCGWIPISVGVVETSKKRKNQMKKGNTKKLTTTADFIANGFADTRGWKSLATLISRAQKHDRHLFHCCWARYPSNRFGWLAFREEGGCRFSGVGIQPEKVLAADEHLIRIFLPFDGYGRDLAELVATHVVKVIRNRRRMKKAA